MPLASDIILDWIHEDGYSLSEAGWASSTSRLRRKRTAIDTSHEHRIGNKPLSILECLSGIRWMSNPLHATDYAARRLDAGTLLRLRMCSRIPRRRWFAEQTRNPTEF